MSSNPCTFQPSCVAFAYQEAHDYIQSHGRKGSNRCKIANNTYMCDEGDYITIRYHGNPIIILRPGVVKVSSCGFRTYTTKERLNWFLPKGYAVIQSKRVWYMLVAAARYDFSDNMRFYSSDNKHPPTLM